MADSLRRFKEINERMEHLKCFYPFFEAYTSRPVQALDYDAPYLALDVLTPCSSRWAGSRAVFSSPMRSGRTSKQR